MTFKAALDILLFGKSQEPPRVLNISQMSQRFKFKSYGLQINDLLNTFLQSDMTFTSLWQIGGRSQQQSKHYIEQFDLARAILPENLNQAQFDGNMLITARQQTQALPSARKMALLEESSDRPCVKQMPNKSISTDDDTSFMSPVNKKPEVPPLKLPPMLVQPVALAKPQGPSLGFKMKLALPMDSQGTEIPRISLVASRKKQRQKMDTTAQEISQITDFLFLSGIEPSKQRELLDKYKITTVLNLCGDLQPIPVFPDLQNFIFKVKDSTTEQLIDIFYECFEIIDSARAAGRHILVHCHQGVSRSSTIVIAYIMMCNNLTYQAAFAHVRFCRNIVSPNAGFVFQLLTWWRWRHGSFIRCMMAEEVAHLHGLQGIIDQEEAAEADIAIKDALQSRLMVCQSNEDELKMRPSFFYYQSGDQCFKRRDLFSPIKEDEVLVVSGLVFGLVAFYGVAVHGIQEVTDLVFKFCTALWEFEGEPQSLKAYTRDLFLQTLETDPVLQYTLIKMEVLRGEVDQGSELDHMRRVVLQKTKQPFKWDSLVKNPWGKLSPAGLFVIPAK